MKAQQPIVLISAVAVACVVLLTCCGGASAVLFRIARSRHEPAAEIAPLAQTALSEEYEAEIRAAIKLLQDSEAKAKQALRTGQTTLRASAMQTGDAGQFDSTIVITQVVSDTKFFAHVGRTQVLFTVA